MADVAIFQPNIMRGGGGEAVAVHTINALKSDHKLTLLTEEEPDFESLSYRYGVKISPQDITVRSVSSLPVSIIDKGVTGLNQALKAGLHLDALKSALIQRRLRSSEMDYDIYVSTANEFFIDGPSLQYIHFPIYSGGVHSKYETWAPSLSYKLYRGVCRTLVGARDFDSSAVLLTNSRWTQDIIQHAYDQPVRVLYPPVNVEDFDQSVGDRESGFVTVGTVHESKRQLEMIRIIDKVRAQGIDTHLHIIGGIGSQAYYEKLRGKAESREYIHLEGHVSRDELVALVEQHQYGLHGRKNEHFGIAIAEQVAGGVIPFVPNGGGQTEIVNERSELLYDSIEDAARKISTVLEDTKLQQELKSDLTSTVSTYSTDQFTKNINRLVTDALDEDSG